MITNAIIRSMVMFLVVLLITLRPLRIWTLVLVLGTGKALVFIIIALPYMVLRVLEVLIGALTLKLRVILVTLLPKELNG